MSFKKIVIYVLMLISILAFILMITNVFMLSKNKVDELNDSNSSLSITKTMDKMSVQSAVNSYISKIKSDNKNKYIPVITAGSINKGSAYAMVGNSKYVINADALKMTLPKGNWSVDKSGIVTGP